jgi:hypothetical protein
VAPGTYLVSLVRRHLLDALLVAPATRLHVAERERESVRFVATGASGAAMRGVIGSRKSMTRAARSHL